LNVCEVLARLEPDRLARRYPDFLSCSGVAANPFLSRLDLEDPETAQLDPFSAVQRLFHHHENRVDRLFSLYLGEAVDASRNGVNYIDFNHMEKPPTMRRAPGYG